VVRLLLVVGCSFASVTVGDHQTHTRSYLNSTQSIGACYGKFEWNTIDGRPRGESQEKKQNAAKEMRGKEGDEGDEKVIQGRM
jgi:hypothetical protein